MKSPQFAAEQVLTILKKYGHVEYGEKVSQLSHAFQAGLIARDAGYDQELILAAFLHDIGHLWPMEFEQNELQKMGSFGIDAHDKWGAEYLKRMDFPPRVIAPVLNHVASKRYLCAMDDQYYETLSEASKNTLIYQGGLMSAEEVAEFEADPFFEDSILVRKIDELAKEEHFEVQEEHWIYLKSLMEEVLNSALAA